MNQYIDRCKSGDFEHKYLLQAALELVRSGEDALFIKNRGNTLI